MYSVYILQSELTGRYYIGMTSNLHQRLEQHNQGETISTRKRGPWKVVYTELFEEKNEAWHRERQIKKYKGGEAFKKLINHGEVA